MPYTTVVPSTTITAAWGNANVRDQVISPFATQAARTSAVTSPVDGMVSYRQDYDFLEGYNGIKWRLLREPDAVNAAALTSIFTGTPNDGDMAYRTDLHAPTFYHSGLAAWAFTGATPITKTTVGVDSASVTLSSIPQDFTHLLVIASTRTSIASSYFEDIAIRVNGDTGTNYTSNTIWSANSVAPAGVAASGQTMATVGGLVGAGGTAAANEYGHSFLYIPNYSSNSMRKGGNGQGNVAGITASQNMTGSRNFGWANTNPITSLTFVPLGGNNIKAGSIVELYGVS